jgi:SAM-dependent methyltransferase
LDLISGDIYSPSLPEGHFDVITLWHVLEHLPDPGCIIRRLILLLKPGGWLLVSLPNFGSIQAQIFKHNWYPFDDVPRHLYHYSRVSLDLLLLEAGMLITRHLLFSRLVNFHSLKHSLLHWSEERFKSRVGYYCLKPLLYLFPPLERLTGRYGILTTIAQRPAANTG